MRRGRNVLLATALVGTLSLVANSLSAETMKYKVVDGEAIPVSLTGQAGDAAKGKKVFLNRKKGNCLACHVVSELKDEPFHGEVGPPLDGAAERWSEGEIRLRIVNPKIVNKDTIMPSFYRTEGEEMKKHIGTIIAVIMIAVAIFVGWQEIKDYEYMKLKACPTKNYGEIIHFKYYPATAAFKSDAKYLIYFTTGDQMIIDAPINGELRTGTFLMGRCQNLTEGSAYWTEER